MESQLQVYGGACSDVNIGVTLIYRKRIKYVKDGYYGKFGIQERGKSKNYYLTINESIILKPV